MTGRVVDNDIIIKLSRFDLIDLLFGNEATAGVLGTAPFVVRSRLKKYPAAATRAESVLARLMPIEPTDEELHLAATFVDAAARENVAFDGGEALLFAMACHAESTIVLTGDRRAIEAAEQLLATQAALGNVQGRIYCLEQVLLSALSAGHGGLKTRICDDRDADRTLAICFSCFSSVDDEDQQRECLESYVAATRQAAPRLLAG